MSLECVVKGDSSIEQRFILFDGSREEIESRLRGVSKVTQVSNKGFTLFEGFREGVEPQLMGVSKVTQVSNKGFTLFEGSRE